MEKKHKAIVGMLLAISMATSMVLMAPSANALRVYPSSMEIEGEIGEFVLEQITLYNDEADTTSVNITLSNNINDAYLPATHIIIDPFDYMEITIGFTINQTLTGVITYQYDNHFISQLVKINAIKITPKVQMIPSEPKGGDIIAIYLISERFLDAHGTIFCSGTGTIHSVVIDDGIGIITLDKNDSGEAMLHLVGKEITPILLQFNITEGEGDDNGDNSQPQHIYEIDVPKGAKIGASAIGTLKKDNVGIPGSIVATDPESSQELLSTDTNGRFSIEFNKKGVWTFVSTIEGKEISASTSVTKKSYTPTVYTFDPKAGEQIEIGVIPGMTVTMSAPGYERTKTATTNTIFFTPPSGGFYIIKAENSTAEGSISITVKEDVEIKLYDTKIHAYTTNVHPGDSIIIEVVDQNDNGVPGITSVEIDKHGESIKTHDLTDTWIVPTTGTFTITSKVIGYYLDGRVSVLSIEEETSGTDFTIPIIIIVVVGAVLILLYIGKKKGWIKFSVFKKPY